MQKSQGSSNGYEKDSNKDEKIKAIAQGLLSYLVREKESAQRPTKESRPIMTAREFCYWLQGYFEINGNQPRPAEFSESLNSEQIKMIKNHLSLVFQHEIDPSYKPPMKTDYQTSLQSTHDGFGPGIGRIDPYGPTMKC